MRSDEFVEFLERVTGIRGLIPDPTNLGGGVHRITSGGYLKVYCILSLVISFNCAVDSHRLSFQSKDSSLEKDQCSSLFESNLETRVEWIFGAME